MCENDVTLALSGALSDARYVHVWEAIVDAASSENPLARYGGAGRVVEAGDAKPDAAGEVGRWIVPATVAFRIDFEGGGDDVGECEVMFCVRGRNFPPHIDELELRPFA
jgi:hypothetical protein